MGDALGVLGAGGARGRETHLGDRHVPRVRQVDTESQRLTAQDQPVEQCCGMSSNRYWQRLCECG